MSSESLIIAKVHFTLAILQNNFQWLFLNTFKPLLTLEFWWNNVSITSKCVNIESSETTTTTTTTNQNWENSNLIDTSFIFGLWALIFHPLICQTSRRIQTIWMQLGKERFPMLVGLFLNFYVFKATAIRTTYFKSYKRMIFLNTTSLLSSDSFLTGELTIWMSP